LGINSGSGDGVFGHGEHGSGVVGTSSDTGNFGRGGVFVSKINAQVRLVPKQAPTTDPRSALPHGVAGDLIAITAKNADGVEVTSLWFCTLTGSSTFDWKQIA
jgi:hypothetical protein